MFVIKRNDGKYVAPSGSEHSYTSLLEDARKYFTKKEAEKDVCPENEAIYDILDLIKY
jgi:hypothetical protein